jgi:hypothetical protein
MALHPPKPEPEEHQGHALTYTVMPHGDRIEVDFSDAVDDDGRVFMSTAEAKELAGSLIDVASRMTDVPRTHH